MTRKEAAAALGITRQELAKLERDGTAQPERDERKVPNYEEQEVERLSGLLASGEAKRPRRKRTVRPPAPSPPVDDVDAEVGADAVATPIYEATIEPSPAQFIHEAERRGAYVAQLEGALSASMAREQQRINAEQAAQARMAWRSGCIETVLRQLGMELVQSGRFPPPQIAYGLDAARALLNALHDHEYGGHVWPYWRASNAVRDALRLPPLPPPVFTTMAPSPWGPIPLHRLGQPGD